MTIHFTGCNKGKSLSRATLHSFTCTTNGFVRKYVFTGTPVVVEYELTEYAETLGGVLQALSEWEAKHKEIVKKGMHREEAVA